MGTQFHQTIRSRAATALRLCLNVNFSRNPSETGDLQSMNLKPRGQAWVADEVDKYDTRVV